MNVALLPAAAGTAVVHARPPALRMGSRAHAHDGRCLECLPAPGVSLAGDVEAVDCPAAARLAARAGLPVEALLRFWTAVEACAKLERRPAGALAASLRRYPRPEAVAALHPGLALRVGRVGDLVVAVAWRAQGTP